MSPAVLERYLAVEQFRALAACLGLRRDRRKGFGGDSRHLRGQRQRRSGHREAVAVLVERHLGTRVELPVRMARARQRKGQRHGETGGVRRGDQLLRSEEHTSELQSLMRISYAVFCLKKKKKTTSELKIP